jgi:hypothetical protein
MSSSEVLLARGPLGRPGCYARATEVAGRPPAANRPDAVNPRLSSCVAGHRAALIRDPRACAESRTNRPGLADGFPLTALDAVGARLLELRARLRGRTDP